MRRDYPILEYDPDSRAILEPDQVVNSLKVPEYCVLAILRNKLNELNIGENETVSHLYSEIGKHPIFQISRNGKQLAIFKPGVGAPLAVSMMEELIAGGCRKFIACGSAGALTPQFGRGKIVVPTSAVRDEGTSYHYLPPAREVTADRKVTEIIEKVLTRNSVEYVLGKTWTTDGLYRETRKRAQIRREEGCLTVEMETAGFLAAAKFRGVAFGQILFCDDIVDEVQWVKGMHKNELCQLESKIINLAIEICAEL